MERKPHRTPARRWLSAILIGIACGVAAYLFIVNFTTAFSTAQCGLPPTDIQVMKLGPDGTVQWKSRIDSGEDDPAYEIVPVPDGGYVLSGRNDFRIHLPAARLIQLNSSGGVVWDRSYPEYQGAFHGLFPGPAGGVVTGAISPGKILVLDADGNVSREIPFAGYEYSSIIAPDTDGGYFVLAENFSRRDSSLKSLGPDGRERWSRDALPLIALHERSILSVSDGGCLVAGYADDVQELNYFRFDSSGRVVWNAMLGKSWDNRPILMAEIRPGTFEILYESARQSGPPPINILETFSATFDDNGTLVQQWMPDISPPITKTPGQDYLAVRFREKDAGSSYGYGTPHLIVRMREDGMFVWQTPVPSDWRAVIRIVPTRDGGCVVLGSSIQKSGLFSCSG
ncbi:hypothetical protein [Methanoregula sp.]|uniref:hypothetical protein n=1 Tax=Methanoregula sp. TaxID=2052170 RepID=UPI0026070086|nr:hypothetical protein [Methanoregula sp.]MDD5143321.1 hypothetical protein [Methanoregula sp.]